MRKIVITLLFLSVLITPAFLQAATPEATYRATLLQLIDVLREQIKLLTQTRAVQLQGNVSAGMALRLQNPDEEDLLVSQFYDGDYGALYVTDGTELIPVGNTTLRALHAQLWNQFVGLLGEEFVRTHMQEFRIYTSATSEYDAFVERDSKTGTWILAVNLYGLDTSRQSSFREMNQLFIHEIGHIFVDEDQNMYEEFIELFWNREDILHGERIARMNYGPLRDDVIAQYYRAHTDRFVTEYAATSQLEDIVESFTSFVTREKSDGDYIKDEKINFFHNYSKLEEVRARMRKNL